MKSVSGSQADLRIGILGAGGRGLLARQAHRPGAGSHIVACCDIAPAILDQCHEQYGRDIVTSTKYEDVLASGLDAGRLENVGDGPNDPIFLWNRRHDGFRLVGDEVYRGDPIDASLGHGGSDGVIVSEFLKFLRNGGSTMATPEAARMSVATGYQATLSLRNGGMPMDIPPIEWTENIR